MTPRSSWPRLRQLGPKDTTAPVTVRQVVAYNLALGRKRRGLTQTELGDQLAGLTGKKWNAIAVSAAESGWDGKTGRLRSFDVTDLVAFSLALEVPITWFFLPPMVTPEDQVVDAHQPWIGLRPSDTDALAEAPGFLSASSLVKLALSQSGPPETDDIMGSRVRSLPSRGWGNRRRPSEDEAAVEALRKEILAVLAKDGWGSS